MILPPWLIDVKVREAGKKGFRIWLPLFLLWPLLLIILALALVVSVIADAILFLAGQRYHHYTLLILGSMQMLADTRGMHADVDGPDAVVHVVIK
jgi:hypothetical protein